MLCKDSIVSIRSMCSFMDCQSWSFRLGTMAFRHSCTLGTEFGVRKELVEGMLLRTTVTLPIMLCKAVCRQPAG